MAFDGIVTKAVISELQDVIVEGKINKIFEPNKNELLLGIYCNGKNYAVDICIESHSLRMNLTTNTKPNPMNAPNFCMLLRKHLIGFRIKSITSIDLERIIFIECEGYNELNDMTRKTLVVELMGKHSNVLLLNESGYIIDTLRHVDSNRELLPAHEYTLPESNKTSFLDLDNSQIFYEIIKENFESSICNAICDRFIGFSKIFLQDVLEKLQIDDQDFHKVNLEKIYDYILTIVSHVEDLHCIEIVHDEKKDFVMVLGKSSPLQVNDFIDMFYTQKEKETEFISFRNSLLKLILDLLKKYTKKLQNINAKLKECENMDNFKLYGELITANLYQIPNQKLSEVTLCNYYDNNKEIVIPLDNSISPSLNAKKYFKKYNKLKTTLKIAQDQKEETLKDLSYLESIVYALEEVSSLLDVQDIYLEIKDSHIFDEKLKPIQSENKKNSNNKKEEHVSQPIITQVGDFAVYIGKNNKQNDYLTLKFAKNTDLWFHTKDISRQSCYFANQS